MRKVLSAIIGILLGQTALANELNLNIRQMTLLCTASDSYCEAYLDGIQTLMQANCQMGGLSELAIGWYPSAEAGRAAFLLWAANNREQANMPAFHGVVSAFRGAFPCE